jgi:hypothetical protein
MSQIHDLGPVKILALRRFDGKVFVSYPENEVAIVLMFGRTDTLEEPRDLAPREVVRQWMLENSHQCPAMITRESSRKIKCGGGVMRHGRAFRAVGYEYRLG